MLTDTWYEFAESEQGIDLIKRSFDETGIANDLNGDEDALCSIRGFPDYHPPKLEDRESDDAMDVDEIVDEIEFGDDGMPIAEDKVAEE